VGEKGVVSRTRNNNQREKGNFFFCIQQVSTFVILNAAELDGWLGRQRGGVLHRHVCAFLFHKKTVSAPVGKSGQTRGRGKRNLEAEEEEETRKKRKTV
jgi:hypothetical protein